ncbi:hypothetical protein Sjap_013619 [Stephania japonica]|uniref:Uncharacterized protein n=1 Tax=Stephania japonica TaxID=461633 RepID=A0AAP0IY48_9MAGN
MIFFEGYGFHFDCDVVSLNRFVHPSFLEKNSLQGKNKFYYKLVGVVILRKYAKLETIEL